MTTMTTVNIGKRPDPITLTEAARKKVADLLAQESVESPLVLRVAVRPGGCSGYSYEMFFDPETAEDDVISQLRGCDRRRRHCERPALEGLDSRVHRRAERRGLPHLEPQRNPDLRLRVLVQLTADSGSGGSAESADEFGAGSLAERHLSASKITFSVDGRAVVVEDDGATSRRCSATGSVCGRRKTAAVHRASAAAARSGSTAPPGSRVSLPSGASRAVMSRRSRESILRCYVCGPRRSTMRARASAVSARPGIVMRLAELVERKPQATLDEVCNLTFGAPLQVHGMEDDPRCDVESASGSPGGRRRAATPAYQRGAGNERSA